MSNIPSIPSDAPFTPEQRLWLNGFLAGVFSNAGHTTQEKAAVVKKPLLILFGSQTGTSETLAKKMGKEAAALDFSPRVLGMEKVMAADLAKEENLLIITSTYGDGEPPDNALPFWESLQAENAPKLTALHYSVLALGDTNYTDFCQFGKNLDGRLEALGAKRIAPRIDCDLEYETPAKGWTSTVFSALSSTPMEKIEEAPIREPSGSKKNPYVAKLLTNRLLNQAGSEKEVRHFEICLADCELPYEAGDALGVIPSNCSERVEEIIHALGGQGEELVAAPDGSLIPLRQALVQHYEITKPSPDFLKAVSAFHPVLATVLETADKNEMKKFLWGREIIDFLSFPWSVKEFIPLLKKLQPRLYSISSSPKTHAGQVHLTVSSVRHHSHGKARKGVCSTFLADRCDTDTRVPVFIQTSHGFRIPSHPDTPMIMVGPGTGIAPFRAFLHERLALGAKGKNWLFFGDQRRASDYLYEEEITAMHRDGHVTKLDLAFSRDQTEKIYVQNRMLESGDEIWAWLEEGAHFYVCGDASRMAKDVDAALHSIIETQGGKDADGAREYVSKLKADQRYQRDVY